MQQITSRENPLVKEYIRLGASARHRAGQGLFVLEGARLAADALDSGARLRAAFFETGVLERHAALVRRIQAQKIPVYGLTAPVAAKMAATQTPQGIFCIAEILDKALSLDKISIYGAYLAVEAVQDPGNIGAMLRSAEALGVDGVLLSPGCADIWSPKVVRASMGAVFRLKVYELQDFCGTLRALRAQGMKTLAATADAGADDLTREPLSGGIVACVGNEGAGLSAGCLSVCDKRVTIRMKGRAESLNAAAAAAILMWEIEKQR